MSTAANGVQAPKKMQTNNSSSIVNTPSVTPIANGQTPTQSTTPPASNAPKYGTLVPNRIFVGGISATTTEAELLQLFSAYGTVKAAKIISDRAGVSKGYGFVTFESEEEAKRLQREADNIVLRERKLNIAPAIKKQPFSRAFEAASPPAVAGTGAQAQYFFPPAGVPYYQGGVAYYPQPNGQSDPTASQQATATAVYQPAPAVYPQQSAAPQASPFPPVMFPPQHIYMPPQYPYQAMPCEYGYYSGPQYMVQQHNSPSRHYYSQATAAAAATTAAAAAAATVAIPQHQQQQQQQQQPPPPPPEIFYSGIPMDYSQECINSTMDGGDVSKLIKHETPVVSLLSLNDRNERDLRSMQSGRNIRCDASQCRNWSKKRQQSVAVVVSCGDNSNSSSSASVVDENLNESNKKYSNNSSYSYHNNYHRAPNSQQISKYDTHFNNHSSQVMMSLPHQHFVPPARRRRGNNNMNNNNNNNRRAAAAAAGGVGNVGGEIGAGDGPISSLGDTCKKLEVMKL